MHIPALLCGFLCGWPWGLAVGFIAPLLRSVIFGMPPMFPTAVAMAFELAVYGGMAGWLYKQFPKTIPGIYAALVSANITFSLHLTGGSVYAVRHSTQLSTPGRGIKEDGETVRTASGSA